MAKSQFIEKIRQNSLIQLDPTFEQVFLDYGTIKFLPADKVLIKRGEYCKYLIVPIDDNLKLFQEGIGDASEKLVGYLQVGRSLLLRSLLVNSKSNYSVKTESPGSVLIVPKDKIVEKINETEGLKEYLKLMGINSGVREFKKYLEESGVVFETILKIFKEIDQSVKRNDKKERVQVSGYLYFCARGEYRLQTGNKSYYLSESSWWGGKGISTDQVYEVKTLENSYFHSLSVERLKKVADQTVIDLIFKEPYLDKFQEDRELNRIEIEPLSELASEKELLQLRESFDLRRLIISEYRENFFEKFSANFTYVTGIDFDKISFNRLLTLSEITLGEMAKVFDTLGLQVTNTSYQDQMHFVMLYRDRPVIHVESKADRHFFWDTVSGMFVLKTKDLNEMPILLVEKQGFEQVEEKLNLRSFKRMISHMLPQQDYYIKSLFFLLIMLTVFDMAIPKITEYIIDNVLPNKDFETLFVCLGGLFLCTTFNLVLATFSNIVTSVYAGEIDRVFSSSFYYKILNLPIKIVQNLEIGGVLNRIRDTQSLRNFIVQEFIVIVESSLKLILGTAFLFYYGWQVAIVALALIPVSIFFRLIYKGKIKQLFDEAFEIGSKSQSIITEIVSSIITVKSSGSEKIVQESWEGVTLKSVEKIQTAEMTNIQLGLILGFLSDLVKVAAIWFAVQLVLKGELMAGSIIAISMYLNMILGAVGTLTGLITKFETLNVTLEKVSDIICEPSEEESEVSRTSHTVELEGKIEFDRVSFRYEENLPWVLREISFSIYPNQTVAIVGKSGCGKTTLAKILVGLLEPTSGRVLLDNFDRHFMAIKSLREQVGYLPQHNHLFAGSIKDNITFNSDYINTDKLNFSSEVANAKEFIFKFPTNFDQYLAEGGLGLSGGEKQRLALARMIYQDPKIIVMDESTSALDTASEMAVLDTIDKVLNQKTVLIIAHRLSTIKNADLILVMDNGEIVEQGTHQELVEKEGFYLKLFENQIALGEVI